MAVEIFSATRYRGGKPVTILYLSKRVYPEEVAGFNAALKKVADDTDLSRVIFNLSKIDYLNSMAIGSLISLVKKVRSAGGRLIFCGVSENITRLFEAMGLLKVFEILEDEDEALREFFPFEA